MKKTVEIYTDGSCLNNPGNGAWAVLIKNKPKDIFLTGREENTTNNRMELNAIIEALKWLVENKVEKATIFSDSILIINSLNLGWKRNKNLDLWKKFDEARKKTEKIEIKFCWIKGHSTNRNNQAVDMAARKEAMSSSKIKNKSPVLIKKNADKLLCKKCGKKVQPLLEESGKNKAIKASCPHCLSYIKFVKKEIKKL